jgi:hypothetical protein
LLSNGSLLVRVFLSAGSNSVTERNGGHTQGIRDAGMTKKAIIAKPEPADQSAVNLPLQD